MRVRVNETDEINEMDRINGKHPVFPFLFINF